MPLPRGPLRGGRIPREWYRWSAGYAGFVTAGLMCGAFALVVRDHCPPWTNLLLLVPLALGMFLLLWLLALGSIGALYGRTGSGPGTRKHAAWNAATRRSVIVLLAIVPGAFAVGGVLQWRGMAEPWKPGDGVLLSGAAAAGWTLGVLLLGWWDARLRSAKRSGRRH